MTRTLLVCLALWAMFLSIPAAAAAPAWHHDSPQRANPRVERPAKAPCIIEIVDHTFAGDVPVTGEIDAPSQCPGTWQKIVLELSGAVKGVQYDRAATLTIGDITVLRTTTPEPSPDGITWTVEKDLTAYAPIFAGKKATRMNLVNYIDKVHTGVFDVKVRIAFYPMDEGESSAGVADMVIPLADMANVGSETRGMIKIPANSERLLLEVYAMGSGGGCEEFWYNALPEGKVSAKYGCKTASGPYREIQVLIDGEVAGIAAPYPHIYTGGWTNPELWYQIPAPRTFDISPVRFDLTPFIGKLNRGDAHQIRLRVEGVPENGAGWTLLPNLHIWRDAGVMATHGELRYSELAPLALDQNVQDFEGASLMKSRSGRRFTARGILHTSHGVVETTVERTLSGEVDHRWAYGADAGVNALGLRSHWSDRHTIITRSDANVFAVQSETQRFGVEGTIKEIDRKEGQRLSTTLSIYDESEMRNSDNDVVTWWQQTSDRFDGTASYVRKVRRPQRDGKAKTCQSYTVRDASGIAYHRKIQTLNGRFVPDDGAGQSCHGFEVE